MVLLSRSFRLVKFYAGSLGCASDCLLAWQNEEATSGGPALANAAIPPAQAEAAANEAPAADVLLLGGQATGAELPAVQ